MSITLSPLGDQGESAADADKKIFTKEGVDDVQDPPPVDEQTDKRLRTRIDRYLLPLMCFTYILQNVDATALGYAEVWGLSTDLGMTSEQYSWLGSILYIAYMIFEFPMGLLGQHFHLGRVVGSVVTVWGLTMMAAGLCQNFAGLAAQRFCLGILQSIITPAWVLLTSIFWKREEQAFRVSLWWSMNGVSLAFGGLISFACGYINVNNIASWKWVFIINGAVTTGWGLVLFLLLPSSPSTARFLSVQDKELAVQRLAGNRTGTRNATIKKYQILEALDPRKDPQGILLFLVVTFNEFPNGGFSNFYGQMIAALGFNALDSSLLGMSVGGGQVLWMLGAAWFTLKYKNVRIIAAMAALGIAFIGFLLQIVVPMSESTSVKAGKMLGIVMAVAYAATCALCVQLPAQNAGGYTKRTTLTSMAFLGYCVGNITGPFAFYKGQTPEFLTGFVAVMVCFGLQWSLLFALRWHYIRENRKRDAQYGPPVTHSDDATTDLTDRENNNFRYVY